MNTKAFELSKLFDKEPDKTCFVLKNNHIVFSSDKKGVTPLMDYYSLYGSSKESLTVVDRIIGKGAMILAILIGADFIVTPIISQRALDFACKYKIKAEYSKVIPFVINRTKDGQCPIEKAVTDIDDIYEGYEVINKTLLKLKG